MAARMEAGGRVTDKTQRAPGDSFSRANKRSCSELGERIRTSRGHVQVLIILSLPCQHTPGLPATLGAEVEAQLEYRNMASAWATS